ncbi:hypothetical protein [Synechococcus sp. SYN20]|uniref:hypothetical protein n=1 Tax=Synechococcus sp. SYN20 TaxID=1050714 RepID=UPI0016495C65|nr:hypothetical protein [Synechococcus sp. SYN20]
MSVRVLHSGGPARCRFGGRVVARCLGQPGPAHAHGSAGGQSSCVPVLVADLLGPAGSGPVIRTADPDEEASDHDAQGEFSSGQGGGGGSPRIPLSCRSPR